MIRTKLIKLRVEVILYLMSHIFSLEKKKHSVTLIGRDSVCICVCVREREFRGLISGDLYLKLVLDWWKERKLYRESSRTREKMKWYEVDSFWKVKKRWEGNKLCRILEFKNSETKFTSLNVNGSEKMCQELLVEKWKKSRWQSWQHN